MTSRLIILAQPQSSRKRRVSVIWFDVKEVGKGGGNLNVNHD